MRSMEPQEMWTETKRYWRIPAIAVLGGLLAFIFSYGVARQYEATATVLMRVTDNSLKSHRPVSCRSPSRSRRRRRSASA